jgi:hypothetical protein
MEAIHSQKNIYFVVAPLPECVLIVVNLHRIVFWNPILLLFHCIFRTDALPAVSLIPRPPKCSVGSGYQKVIE